TTLNTSRSPYGDCCLRSGVTSTHTARPVYSGHASNFELLNWIFICLFSDGTTSLVVFVGGHSTCRSGIEPLGKPRHGFPVRRRRHWRRVSRSERAKCSLGTVEIPAKEAKERLRIHRHEPGAKIPLVRDNRNFHARVSPRLSHRVLDVQPLDAFHFAVQPRQGVANDVR